jgi:membrane associated rhomboid family serine protease
MIPLYDENRPTKASIITIGLIFLNTVIFLFSLSNLDSIIQQFGFVPQNLLSSLTILQAQTVFTSMFLHGGFWHLLGNMWFLWVFGNNLEVAMGRLRFLLFYLTCGAFAALGYALITPDKAIPIIGASGAISGVLGGYFILFPRHKIRLFFLFFVFSVPAIIFLIAWVLLQLLYPQPGVAIAAHLIGFVTGILLVKLLKKS